MIPRTLVPWNARPAESPSTELHKTVTALDDRTLIPAYFVQGPLETRTSIPASLPLESIAARVVVPRDLPVRPLEAPLERVLPHSGPPIRASPFLPTPPRR